MKRIAAKEYLWRGKTIVDTACKVVKDSSRDIYNLILRGKKQGIKIQEETITEILLLNLAEKLKGQIKITLFNKIEEGRNGADWEWYIKKNGKWIGFSVQAKILNYKNGMYDSLFKKNQIDKLIVNAFKKDLIPIYSFYNFTEKAHGWRYRGYHPLAFPADTELIGWTYATALEVYKFKKIGKVGLNDFKYRNINSGLMSMFFCNPWLFQALIEEVEIDIKDVLANMLDEKTGIAELFLENDFNEVPSFGPKNLDAFPHYVKNLYRGEDYINGNKEDDPLYVIIIDLDINNEAEGFRF